MPFYIMFCIILNFGLVDRNHFKLYNELLALVLGRCGVFHAEVNDTEYVVVGENGEGNRYGNGRVRPEWAEQDRERGKGGASASRAGIGERRKKRRMLVGYVQEYWACPAKNVTKWIFIGVHTAYVFLSF